MALTRATDKIIGDSNGNLNLSGIVTAARFSGPLVPSGDLNVGNNIKLGTASGIITATTFSGNISGATGTFTGNLGVGGVLTYEDVTNIDSIGIITARSTVSIADSIVHTGDTNTSLRFPAADTITAETAGVERFRITSDGKFGFGNSGSFSETTMAEFTSSVGGGAIGANITIRNSSTNSVNNVAELRLKTAHGVARFFKYNTGETYLSSHVGGASDLVLEANGAKSFRVNTNTNERLRVDLAGRFLVGTTAYKSNLNASSDVQIGQFVGKNDNECACLSVFSYAGTTNPTARGAKLQLHRARSTDGTTNTAVAQNDLIGSIEFKGNDGTSFTAAARIDVNVDDAPGTDDMPGRMVFSTSANGSGAPTERMVISSEGYVTKPNLPTFCARWQSPDAQDLNSGDIIIFTHVASATTRWNNGGHYSTSTGKFTAPVAGFYYFAGRVMSTGWNDGDDIQDLISIQSSAGIITYPTQRRSRFRSDADANGYYTTSISAQVQAAAGATFWLQSNRNGNGSGWDSASSQYSFFTGWLIG